MAEFNDVTYAAAVDDAVKKANDYTDSMLNVGQHVGDVTNGGSFPATRKDGSPLHNDDYVKALASSTFPFTIGTVTFDNRFSTAIYLNGNWYGKPGTLQDTGETPVKNPTAESIDGTGNTQAEINVKNKAEFAKKLNKATETVSLEHAYIHKADGTQGLMQINTNANAGLAIVRRDLDKQINVPFVPTGDDDATSKHYVDTGLNSKRDKITGNQQVYVTDTSGVDMSVPYSKAKSSNSIAQRDNAGRIAVGTPTTAEHAATKGYVDDKVTTEATRIDADLAAEISRAQAAELANTNAITAEKTHAEAAEAALDAAKADKATTLAGYGITDAYTKTETDNKLLLKQDKLTASTHIAIDTDNKISSTLEGDGSTTEIDGEQIKVKDKGITLAKLADQAGQAGKAYIVQNDGTTALENVKQYKRVSSFATEAGNTYTEYYLDTPCVVGSTAYSVGLYVWSATDGFTKVADIGGGGSSTTPILVGIVSPGGFMPTVRPDGNALVIGDYVKPYSGATFPFTVSGVTFNGANDTAVYMTGGNWLVNASVYQKSNQTPVADKAAESVKGSSSTAVYQSQINIENVAAIKAAGHTVEFTMDSDFIITLKLKDKSGNVLSTQSVDLPLETMKVVKFEYDNTSKKFILTVKLADGTEQTIEIPASGILNGVVTETAMQTLTNKIIDADDNTISDLEIDCFKETAIATTISPAGAVDTKLATEKAVSDKVKVDNATIERDTANGIRIKNEGITFIKFAPETISTIIPDIGAVNTKIPTEFAIRTELNKKLSQLATMPTAVVDYAGKIVQYIGTTTADYTNGYFYICEEDETIPGSYHWTAISVQSGGSGSCPYAVGDTKVQYTELDNPNTLYTGTVWTDITSVITGRYIQFDEDSDVATEKEESLPAPTVSLSQNGQHSHAAISNGAHTHSWNGYYTVSNSSKNVQCASVAGATGGSGGSTNSAGAHTHTISPDGNHTHTATVDTSGVYGSGSAVRPLTYTVKLWQRTA